MRALKSIVIIALLAQFAVAGEDPLAAFERRQQEIFTANAPGVVLIADGDSFGSGFFVTADGLILTNAHVVGKASTVAVVLGDGRRVTGQVVELAREGVDLALVQAPVTGVKPVALELSSDLRIGSWVASIGHGKGAIWSYNTGIVSNIYPDGKDHPVFQTQIPLNPGNSGGPVLDKRGRAVGVVTAQLANTASINFAIRTEVALRSLSGLARACDCLVIQAPNNLPVFVDGEMRGLGPRVVIPAQPKRYQVFVVVDGVMKKAEAQFPRQRTIDLK